MARMQRSLFAQLNALAEEIASGAEKSASQKKADGPTPADPGTYQGSSSHPTASVDNNVQTATEGARSSEYESDIKKQQGALAVDNTPEMSQEGRQDEVQLNINTNAKATGEDPSTEHDYKGDKDDPGTSHPAKANDGEKYSSVSFKQAHATCSNLGNDILANLINFGTAGLKTAGMPEEIKEKIEAKKETAAEEKGESAAHEAAESSKTEAAEHKEAAFAAGYELAKTLGLQKEAAEAAVREVCANTLREADEMADLFIGFYNEKAAGEDPTDEASEGESHDEGETGSGASAAPAAPEAGAGDASLADVPPSEPEALQELAMALQELGISPEELLSMIQGGGAGVGAEGGMPPEAAAGGGMPPEAAAGATPPEAAAGAMPPEAAMMGAEPKMAKAAEIQTIATAVRRFQNSGRFEVKEARTKRSRHLRDIMKAHVRELVSR